MGIINRFNTIRKVNRNFNNEPTTNINIDAVLHDDSEDKLRNAIDALTPIKTDAPAAYSVLGVSITDNVDTITAVYKAKLKQYHPDKNPNATPQEQAFYHTKTNELNMAYNEIINYIGGNNAKKQ
ncbi:MAG: J domain-containing protein [Ignavibacteria bacterium]|jgi:DnaJ-class molecular chaperone|nr:J domain-containing protein [Ignavibacteria bacterium]